MSEAPKRIFITECLVGPGYLVHWGTGFPDRGGGRVHHEYTRADIADELLAALKDAVDQMSLSGWDLHGAGAWKCKAYRQAQEAIAKAEGLR